MFTYITAFNVIFEALRMANKFGSILWNMKCTLLLRMGVKGRCTYIHVEYVLVMLSLNLSSKKACVFVNFMKLVVLSTR